MYVDRVAWTTDRRPRSSGGDGRVTFRVGRCVPAPEPYSVRPGALCRVEEAFFGRIYEGRGEC